MEVSVQTVLDALEKDHICSNDQLAELKHRFANADAQPDELVAWLCNAGVLTGYQADVLCGRDDGPLAIGPYLVLEPIRGGRLAGMLHARQRELNFPVSLKVVKPVGNYNQLQTQLARFQREARISSQVDHPHVVRTFQVGGDGDHYFIACEQLSGYSLSEVIEGGPDLSEDYGYLWGPGGKPIPGEICRLMWEALAGLEHLHEQGILHGNLQPQNVWLSADGHAKLLDFSAARDSLWHLDSPRADAQAAFADKHDYLAPEQIARPQSASVASDLFSMGCTLYFALTGRAPYTEQEKFQVPAKAVPPASRFNDWVTEELDYAVNTLIALNPADRFPSARAASMAVARCAASRDSIPMPHQSPELKQFLGWLKQREIARYAPRARSTGTDG